MVELRAEDIGINPAEQGVEAVGIERHFGKGIYGHKLEVRLEHSVQNGDNHRIVEGVEHGVQRCEEEIGYGISTQRLGEAQKSKIGFKHRRIVNFWLQHSLASILLNALLVVLQGLLHRHKRLTARSVLMATAIEVALCEDIDIDIAS